MMGKRVGRNIAAKGAVSTGSLRIPSTRPTGSTAGLEAGRSTYIQPNSSGYGNVRPRPQRKVSPPTVSMDPRLPYKGAQPRRQISSYRQIEHWTKVDRALSKRLS